MRLPTSIAYLCAFAATALALDPIVVQEQEFIVEKSGARFVILGVDYQPGGQGAYGTGQGDPLSSKNSAACLRDAALMQSLGINTIRVYNLDPTLNHDLCASIFNYAGIYMVLDVGSPLGGQSLNRADPASSYNADLMTRVFTVVEAFKDYPNVLGFFSANEVINDLTTAKTPPPYIRAIQRDTKQYIAAHASRTIPVGYSAAQVQEVLHDSWAYLSCDNSNDGSDLSRSDFFGLNSYSWCGGQSSFTISGYNTLVDWFSKTTIPVFFSEYGCIKPSPRLFEEVPVLYGPQMTVLSGGLVYQWDNSIAGYGLTETFTNGSSKLLADYNTLQSQYNKLNITLISTQNSTATNLKAPRCNANLIQNSAFSKDFNIPAQPKAVAALISKGISNAPTGSIVSVTQTVPVPVYQTNGAEITGLAVHGVNGANTPGSTSAGSGKGGSSTSTGFAARATPASFGGSAVAAAVFGAAVIVL